MFPRWAWILLGVATGGILLGVSTPSSRTPVSMAQIRTALLAAWPAALGGPAPPNAVRMLAAQIALETNNGSALMAYNLGNFKATAGQPFVTFATTEVVNGKTLHLNQNFRAFPDLGTAANAYLIAMRGRFGAAWPFALAGDTAGFAHALKEQGYYTADEGQYAAGLVARGAPPLGAITTPDVGASTDPPSNPGGSGTFENDDSNEPTEPTA